MAKSGSVGARRGAQQVAEMSMSQAKSLSTKAGSSKPNLDKASNNQSKVTNKPKEGSKRMK